MISEFMNNPGRITGKIILFIYLCLLTAIVMPVGGCDRTPDSQPLKYVSWDTAAAFLKENYFEVLPEPVMLSDFEYTLLDGSRERLSENRGKVVFLNFWATWCYPCRKEMPDMDVLAISLKDEPFRILALNFSDSEEKVKRFVERFKHRFDIAIDRDKSIASGLSVRGLPTTVIIDKRGRLLARLVGPADWKNEEFRYLFQALSRK